MVEVEVARDALVVTRVGLEVATPLAATIRQRFVAWTKDETLGRGDRVTIAPREAHGLTCVTARCSCGALRTYVERASLEVEDGLTDEALDAMADGSDESVAEVC